MSCTASGHVAQFFVRHRRSLRRDLGRKGDQSIECRGDETGARRDCRGSTHYRAGSRSISLAGILRDRIRGGELADVTTRATRHGRTPQGDGAPGAVIVARGAIGVAIRAGARPNISSVEEFRRSLLAAKSIVFDPAQGSASGIHFARVLDRLGLPRKGRNGSYPVPEPLKSSPRRPRSLFQERWTFSRAWHRIRRSIALWLQNTSDFVYLAAVLVGAKAGRQSSDQASIGPGLRARDQNQRHGAGMKQAAKRRAQAGSLDCRPSSAG
jgi:hypothetical protein